MAQACIPNQIPTDGCTFRMQQKRNQIFSDRYRINIDIFELLKEKRGRPAEYALTHKYTRAHIHAGSKSCHAVPAPPRRNNE